MKAKRADHLWFWLMAGPSVFSFCAFALGPMLYSFYLSLCRYDVVSPPAFIGLRNYMYLLQQDPAFWPSIKVTLVYAAVHVPLALAMSLAVAMLLNADVKGQGMFRTFFYLPSILPSAASAAVFVGIFNPRYGLLNHLLAQVGIQGPAWLGSTSWALPCLIIISLWGFGNAMLIFLGGLKGVPVQLYEAASIDGAGRWGQFRHVTLPMISPVIFFNLVMGTISALKVFDLAYAVGAAQGQVPGGPARATLFYVLHLYQMAFNYFHMGPASAMAWMLFAVVMTLTVLNFTLGKRWVHYE